MRVLAAFFVAAVAVAFVPSASAQSRARFKLEEVQATLAVQGLDGWLLASEGTANPIAVELVNPNGATARLWFVLIPAQGPVTALAHADDAAALAYLGDAVKTYSSKRDAERALRTMLRGRKLIAMEYAPKSAIPALTRVSATTAKWVEGAGAKVVSSANLVQFTKSLWGPEGRVAHYVAAHHLHALIAQAMAHVAAEVRAGRKVTEYDVQQFIFKGYSIRGVVGDPPAIAAGPNTADPNYSPPREGSRVIADGDLLRMTLWARLEGAPRPIYANLSWMAFVGARVPKKYAEAFAVVVAARDAALALIRDRVARRRAIRGFEPARAARDVINQAGMGGYIAHRLGHSLDTSVIGDGTHLDDGAARDSRSLAKGAGFTVEPGVYVPGDYGVKTEVDAFLGREGVEVTSPLQKVITPLLATQR